MKKTIIILVMTIGLLNVSAMALEVVVDTLVAGNQSEAVNNTTKIQAVLQSVITAGGGTVVIPTGNYYTVGISNFNASAIALKGEYGAVLRPIGNYDGLVIGAYHNANDHITVENLKFEMDWSPNNTGIRAIRVDDLRIRNVVIRNGKIGVNLDNTCNVTVDNTICRSQSAIGLKIVAFADKVISTGNTTTTVTGGSFSNGEIGIVIEGGYGINIIGASIERNNSYAIDIIPSTAPNRMEYPGAINITGNYIERNAQVSGDAFIRIGAYNPNVSGYAREINISGNYLNWDVENPRQAVQPFYKFDRCADVTVKSNRYFPDPSTIYFSEKTAYTYWDTVVSINDRAGIGQMTNGVRIPSYGAPVQLVYGSVSNDCINPLSMDTDGNCKIDFFDLVEFASEWMTCGFENQSDCWK